jgi:histidine triad (HIT) family protein
MSNCIFCEISNRQSPAGFVYDDRQVFGIVSLDQPNPYKVLIIPHAHVETVYDLSELQAARIFQATVKIARAVRAVSRCQGLNLVQSNGRVAGQDVFHFHQHIIPRFEGDAIILKWQAAQKDGNELSQMADEIRSKIESS